MAKYEAVCGGYYGSDGEGVDCGWGGPERNTREEAQRDADEHEHHAHPHAAFAREVRPRMMLCFICNREQPHDASVVIELSVAPKEVWMCAACFNDIRSADLSETMDDEDVVTWLARSLRRIFGGKK